MALRAALQVSVLLLPIASNLAAQEPSRRVVPTPMEFLATQDDSLFSLYRSQEDIHAWEQAQQELRDGQAEAAVERLHRLLDQESGGIVAVGPGQFLALRHAVVLTLANLSAAGKEAYEALVAREAGGLLDQPLPQLDEARLRLLADRFPAADVGVAARRQLGDLCLERGDGHAAAAHYRVALGGTPIQSRAERALLERLECADALADPAASRARSPRSIAVDDVLTAVPPTAADREWRGFGGGGSGSRPMPGPVGRPTSYITDKIVAPGFDYEGTYAMQPVGGLDAVYVNTGYSLQAIDPLRRELLWDTLAPMEDQGDLQSGRDILRAVNQNMILSAAVADDVVVAPLQVPTASNAVRYQNTFTIIQPIPERRLFAFERQSGKLLWSHYDRVDGPRTRRFRNHESSSPPLVVGDTVYAATHDRSGAIAFYLSAYDLRTGEPRWRRLICSSQQEVNMFGNARMEFASSSLCADRGLIYGCSNLGVCFAVEMETGHVRWVTGYDVIRMPETRLREQETRPVYFQNSTPVVVDDVLCATPLDSPNVLGIDCETGAVLWQLPFVAKLESPNYIRWLFGAIGDEFLLAGRGVVAVKARPSTGAVEARQVRLDNLQVADRRLEQPRPAVADELIYFPTSLGLQVFDINGVVDAQRSRLRLQVPGNLLLTGGLMVSLAQGAFELLLDVTAMRSLAERELEQRPNDPSAILRLCTLQRAMPAGTPGFHRSLETLYRRGLQICDAEGRAPDDPMRRNFQRQLFEITLEQATDATGEAAIGLLRDAVTLAPDDNHFLRAASQLLVELRARPAELLSLLDELERRVGSLVHSLPGADGAVRVAAYCRWQRAQLLTTPEERIDQWQTLLEQYPDEILRGRPIAQLAETAIGRLIDQHGDPIYAAIEARARAELQAAGDDAYRLRSIASRYPHSSSARLARDRMLDAAVRNGDLATAIDVYSASARTGEPSAGLLRRVLQAALVRGNVGLARKLVAQLDEHADVTSDWSDDDGRSYGEILADLQPSLTQADRPAGEPLQIPLQRLSEIPSLSSRQGFRYLETHVAPGFPAPIDRPFYVGVDDQLRALDPMGKKLPLFQRTTHWIGEVWLCDQTLLIPGMTQLTAIHYRTGDLQWQRQADAAMFDYLGVIDGVLIVLREGGTARDMQLLGIEPLTGKTVFVRPIDQGENELLTKATEHGVLLLRPNAPNGPCVEVLDPLTGRSSRSYPISEPVRQQLGLAPQLLSSRLFPQYFGYDGEFLFLPIDGQLSASDRPRLAALRTDGTVAWSWEGTPGRQLWMPARRGDRIVLVERTTPGGSRVLLLDAKTGEVQRRVELGDDLQVLNWRRQNTVNQAPAALICTDLTTDGQDRRLLFVGIDEGLPTFVQSLAGSDQVVPGTWFDDEHLVYALRPRLGGRLRMFALNLADRSGALADRQKFAWLPIAAAGSQECQLTTQGPYTVIVTDGRLHVFGDGNANR
jgi:outer membrane protein assembly factor BamB